jgi:hypothetical protein
MFFHLILINIHSQKDNSKVLYFNHNDNAGSEVKKGPNNVNHGLSPRFLFYRCATHARGPIRPTTTDGTRDESRVSPVCFSFFFFFSFSLFLYTKLLLTVTTIRNKDDLDYEARPPHTIPPASALSFSTPHLTSTRQNGDISIGISIGSVCLRRITSHTRSSVL